MRKTRRDYIRQRVSCKVNEGGGGLNAANRTQPINLLVFLNNVVTSGGRTAVPVTSSPDDRSGAAALSAVNRSEKSALFAGNSRYRF